MFLQFVGMLLAFGAAAIVAFSMFMQRYALSHPGPKVKLLNSHFSPQTVWGLGILVYSLGNALYSAALLFGPLSLLGSVFTTLLAFNLLFARTLLNESLTRSKLIGATIIFVGAVLSLAGSPSETDALYTPAEMERFVYDGGGIYFLGMFTLLFVCVLAILWYERQPPARHEMRPRLHAFMGILYPASLGLDEGIAHLAMRAAMAMFAECGITCPHWTLFIAASIWLLAGLASLPWLHIVYRRHETTLALPVEYGAVQVCAVCSGLIFFDEADSMLWWQLAICISGALVILIGIAVGRPSRDYVASERNNRCDPSDVAPSAAAQLGISVSTDDSSQMRGSRSYSPLGKTGAKGQSPQGSSTCVQDFADALSA